MTLVYLGLGSNLGDRVDYLRRALDLLAASGTMTVIAVSSLYETAPMEVAEQPAFLNAVAAIQTELAPLQLLELVKTTEHAVGRIERFRYGPREVDVDILLYDDLVFSDATLSIPHPRLPLRAFALVPLDEIAPKLILPGTGATIASYIPVALALGSVTQVQSSEWYAARTHG